MRWTREQELAITATDDVLLTASAGTGKTTTIVGKVLWLLGLEVGQREDGQPILPCPDPCPLERIAAITFTEKAAYDLKVKLRKEILESERGEELRWEVDRASVGTIHAFCAEILRDHALRLGIDPTFRVLDERETRIQQDELIRDLILGGLRSGDPASTELVKQYGLYARGDRKATIDHVRNVMRDLRWRAHRYAAWTSDGDDRTVDPAILRRTAESAGIWASDPEAAELDLRTMRLAAALHRLGREATREWLSWLEEENLRDFDSLILDVRRLLTREGTRPALESIRRRYRILIIDEFQDTDGAQREIAFALAGVGTHRRRERPQLFLVGDPKQSIYRFRGADISVWNEVRRALCGDAEPLRLSHNFRSEPGLVRFVNRTCGRAMQEQAQVLGAESPESAVKYHPLSAFRSPSGAAGLEWLAADSGQNKAEREDTEARLVASRIARLVDRFPVIDPETNGERECRYRDVAVLARKKDNLAAIERGLREYGIPYYNTSTRGLADRQEILDLVNLLQLIENPRDDLRAFAYLRSPFVGLRDEILARIRLDPDAGRGSYLRQAEGWLARVDAGEAEWFAAPESPRVGEVEREALRRGLLAIREAHALVDRTDPSEILESVLETTGYRLHLLLRHGARQALANIERFLALLEEHRHLPLGTLLLIWDRWREEDLGIPQAPLFSKEDDVVTLSTIHTAKGLEWPIVFLAATNEGPSSGGRLTGSYWSDPAYGPVLLPKKKDRGPWATRLFERYLREEHAEEARLLYVALTRARDRLILSGPTEKLTGFAAWLGIALPEAVEAHEADPEPVIGAFGREDPEAAAAAGGAAAVEAQLDLFSAPGARAGAPEAAEPPASEATEARSPEPADATQPATEQPVTSGDERPDPPSCPLVIHREPTPIQERIAEPPITLGWLAELEPTEPPDFVRPVPSPVRSFLSSATELMKRDRDPAEWELIYRHGVRPPRRFAPAAGSGGLADPTLRGRLIHGVLERIEEEAEIAGVLNETISGLDAPEMEELLEPGTPYREALEREIERVVRGEEWRWYVEGENHRELAFVHLSGLREWRHGAYDLFRPARQGAAPDSRDAQHWIIDFKTHEIGAGEAEKTAREYDIQVRLYREAAEAVLAPGPAASAGSSTPVRVALHFTHPNLSVERDGK
ncbi:MAG: UvrD-helicase domain-containing protein [Gemmatimonadota bacterium]